MNQATQIDQNIQYMHYRGQDVRGGATVAIMPIANNRVYLSVARCGPQDVFNKKVGRDIATGRLRAYIAGRTSVQIREIPVDPLNVKASVDNVIGEEMAADGLF